VKENGLVNLNGSNVHPSLRKPVDTENVALLSVSKHALSPVPLRIVQKTVRILRKDSKLQRNTKNLRKLRNLSKVQKSL